MSKLDPKTQLPELYRPAREPHLVDVPLLRFAMIDGHGAPGCPAFQSAVEAIFTLSYRAKFNLKKQGTDYAVMPLEGLWWADDMTTFITDQRDHWRWTLLIHQPDFIPVEVLELARLDAVDKVGAAAAAIRFEEYAEGLCAQLLHLGPFSTEGPAVERLHALITESGGTFAGQQNKHHEIYLSDFRRTAPEKLKTLLRQPFLPAPNA